MTLALHIDAPFLSIPEFARRTGQTVTAVTSQIDLGQIPVIKLKDMGSTEPSKKTKSKRFVNMIALHKISEKQAEQFIDQKV